MHHLITFLGRKPRSYRTAAYHFDGGGSRETFFFGHALHQHLVASEDAPGRLLILGTETSMWERLADFLELNDAVMTAAEGIGEFATEAGLAPLAGLLTAHLGIPVDLKIIPYGRDRSEQLSILRILAGEVGDGDRITLDITHGFRHLPTISTLAALYLRRVRGASIAGVYYGALEMTEAGRTPVVRLDGLLEIDEWNEALARHDASGDHGIFAPLLARDGASEVLQEHIRMSGFQMRSFLVGAAASRLRGALAGLNEIREDSVSALFREQLRASFSWIDPPRLGEQQRRLASAFLSRGDFFRAASFGVEARITVEARGPSVLDFEVRERAKERLKDAEPDFRLLNTIRNTLIHSGTLKGSYKKYNADIQSPIRLKRLLRHLLK